MKGMTMMKSMMKATALGATLVAAILLSGCPTQPSYSSTLTPVYVATGANGLYVYSGSSWTNYTVASTSSGLPSDNLSSLVVSGSGSGAEVFVGTSATGVAMFDGSAWTKWTNPTDGLGSNTINRLLIASTLYAATANGLSAYNFDGSSPLWTNDTGSGAAYTSIKDVFSYSTYTYIAADTAGLFILNGTGVETHFAKTQILNSASVQAVYVDGSMDVIVGTDQGLSVLYYGSTSFSTNLLPSNTSVNQICMDTSGNLYAATNNGLYVIGTSATRLFSTAAYCVCVDGAGTIYAGIASGLQKSTDKGSTWTSALSTSSSVTAVATTAPVYQF